MYYKGFKMGVETETKYRITCDGVGCNKNTAFINDLELLKKTIQDNGWLKVVKLFGKAEKWFCSYCATSEK